MNCITYGRLHIKEITVRKKKKPSLIPDLLSGQLKGQPDGYLTKYTLVLNKKNLPGSDGVDLQAQPS